MKDIGKPLYFNVELALDAVQQWINADEIVYALEMLKNFPGYYRDFPTQSMIDMRAKIYQKLPTVKDYCFGERDHVNWGDELYKQYQSFQRMQNVKTIIEYWNKQGRKVFIYEFGPGHFWLPYGLMKDNLDFKYRPLLIENRNKDIYEEQLNSVLRDAPEFHEIVIFVAFEVIEHLFHEDDILHVYQNEKIDADYIFISTPKHTLGGGRERSNTNMIAHLRTYTPNELVTKCMKWWPHYIAQFHDDPQMWVELRRPEV